MTEATVTLKLASYPVLVWAFSYTGISKETTGILAVLLVLDVVTALIRVAITNPKAFSSRIGIVGILSKCLTFMIPFIIAIVGKGAGMNMTTFSNYALNVLVIYEGWSVIGNIGQIRAKDTSLNEYDAISFLIRKIQALFKNLLDNVYRSEINSSNKPEVPEVPEITPEQTDKNQQNTDVLG